jgi:hypothetical protein
MTDAGDGDERLVPLLGASAEERVAHERAERQRQMANGYECDGIDFDSNGRLCLHFSRVKSPQVLASKRRYRCG